MERQNERSVSSLRSSTSRLIWSRDDKPSVSYLQLTNEKFYFEVQSDFERSTLIMAFSAESHGKSGNKRMASNLPESFKSMTFRTQVISNKKCSKSLMPKYNSYSQRLNN